MGLDVNSVKTVRDRAKAQRTNFVALKISYKKVPMEILIVPVVWSSGLMKECLVLESRNVALESPRDCICFYEFSFLLVEEPLVFV